MAQRRMFSKEITNSSDFLMMSQSAQNLYFHFGMNADDDGFCEVFTVMRMTDSKPDDLQSLHQKWFIFVIDSKVCIVKDWHENNQLRLDRYKKSKYFDDPKYKEIYRTIMEEKIKEIGLYSSMLNGGKPMVAKLATQVRLGKDREGNKQWFLPDGKIWLELTPKDEIEINQSNVGVPAEQIKDDKRFQEFWDLYNKKVDRWAVERKWKKLKPKDIESIFIHLPWYIRETPDKQFRKNPETYINNKSRENETITWWVDYTNINNFHEMMMQDKVPELKTALWVEKYFEIKELWRQSPLYLSF